MRGTIIFAGTLILAAAAILGWRHSQPATPLDTAWPPARAVTGSEIAARPEGHLVYPNAEVFARPLSNEHTSGFGLSNSYAGTTFFTKDTPDQVYAWYKTWLLAHGWQLHYSGYGSGPPEISTAQYLRGTREVFTVGIEDPKLLGAFTGGKWPSDRTIVMVHYTIMPYTGAK